MSSNERLVVAESCQFVRIEQYVYHWTVVVVRKNYQNKYSQACWSSTKQASSPSHRYFVFISVELPIFAIYVFSIPVALETSN